MSLKRQVVSGVIWVTLAQLFARVLIFASNLVLPKLLAPSIFGLAGTAMIVIGALNLFQDIGFESALIYRRKNVDEASDTTFWLIIGISLFLTAIAYLSAPLTARLFDKDPAALIPVLRALALTFIISSFGRLPLVLLSRELNFRRRVVPEIASSVVATAIAIFLAFRGAGVWSLVWRELIRSILLTSLVWMVTPYRPRFRFNPALARELFDYGKHIVSSQGLIFLITNIDNIFVTRLAGTVAFGHYVLAYQWSNTPATQINSVISQVMFPTFAKLADGDPAQIRQLRARYYLMTVRYVTWLTTPLLAGMMLFARPFITDFYGAAWAPAIVPLQLLAIYGFIRSIAANMGSVFRAMGKPQWLTYIALWRLLTMAAALYPVTIRWGIVGVSWLSVAVAVADFLIASWLVGKLLEAPWRAYARMLIPTCIAAFAGGFLALEVYPYLPLAKAIYNLALAGVILVISYAVFLWLIDAQLRSTLRSLAVRGQQWWLVHKKRGPASSGADSQPSQHVQR